MAQCGQVQAMVLRTLGIEMCRVYLCVRCFSTLKVLSMYLYNLSIYNSRFCFDMSYTFATYYVSNILYTLWSICINTLYMHYSDVDSEHETMDRKHSLQSIIYNKETTESPWSVKFDEICTVYRHLFQQRRRLRAYSIYTNSPRSTFILKMNTVKKCLRR